MIDNSGAPHASIRRPLMLHHLLIAKIYVDKCHHYNLGVLCLKTMDIGIF